MQIQVRVFAEVRQKIGLPVVMIDLPENGTVADLKTAIANVYPRIAGLVPHLLIAIDSEYAGDHQIIPEGAEIAIIPPVSGGAR